MFCVTVDGRVENVVHGDCLANCVATVVSVVNKLDRRNSRGKYLISGVSECQSINQSINVKFVGRRYTRRPGAPTVVSGTHDQKVHS